MIAVSDSATPTDSHGGCAPGAAALALNPASRSVAAAPRSAAPPTVPAVPGPDSKERHTAVATPTGAAAPTAPATGGGGGNDAKRGSAHPADGARLPTAARSASRAARHDAHSTAGAIPPGALPVPVCAAARRRSGACRAAGHASRWRRSASLSSGRAPSAGNDMPPAAQEVNVWIAKRLSVAPPAASDARTVPTPALPSVI